MVQFKFTTLGGGIQGIAPKMVGGGANTNSGSGMDGGNNRAMNRFVLRKAWNNNLIGLDLPDGQKTSLTPFRRVHNAGDLLNRPDFSTGGPNQVNNVRNQSLGSWKLSAGSVIQKENPIPASSCNPKYVYDSSNYIRFKKQQALNRNYNDYSFGGSNNASQVSVALARL